MGRSLFATLVPPSNEYILVQPGMLWVLSWWVDPQWPTVERLSSCLPTRKKNNKPETLSKPLSFDTDLYYIAVDNGCSYTVTNDIKDYIETPRKTKTKILGSNGNSTASYVGTVKWRIEDDNGRHHEVILPGTYYSEYVPYKLISPQHWAQTVSIL